MITTVRWNSHSLSALMRVALMLTVPVAPVVAAPDPVLLPAVAALLAEGPPGTRYGLSVTTLDGEPLLAIAADQRFIAASNTKMYL